MELTFQGGNGNSGKGVNGIIGNKTPDHGICKDNIGHFLTLCFGNLYHKINIKI
jgi:hypothetical protein